MKLRWAVALLALIAAGVAVGWGLGLWEEPSTDSASPAGPEPSRLAPPPTTLPTASKKLDALDTAAWMLAHSQRAPAGVPSRADNGVPCGDDGMPCPRGRICISDACVVSVCAPNSSPKEVCAQSNGQTNGQTNGKSGRCCGGACLDVTNDPANCGSCGHLCGPGVDCVNAICQAQSCSGKMAGTACMLPQGPGSCCRDRCAEKASWIDDRSNCGGCGHACSPGLSCVQGICVDPATGRLPDFNCNQAGHQCRPDELCVIDACYPRECGAGSDGQLCPIGSLGQVGHCCSGSCHDLFSDTDNCRACGVRCDPGQTCRNGECR